VKKPIRKAAPNEYEYKHGPLANGLSRSLKKLLSNDHRFAVLNADADSAVVDKQTKRARIIFEVKTSSDLGAQLYKAIGQLFYYEHARGSDMCSKVLVLPIECKGEIQALSPFLSKLNIHTIVGDGSTFTTLGGISLDDFVRGLISD
jgi:hypothetical protein